MIEYSTKHLYRSTTNKVIFGLMGGLGEYFNLDPVVLRVAYIFLTFITGLVPGCLAYIVASLVVPRQR